MHLRDLTLMGLESYQKHLEQDAQVVQDIKQFASKMNVTLWDRGGKIGILDQGIEKASLNHAKERRQVFNWIMERVNG